MKVTELFIYPIKSCQGIELSQAQISPKGFLWDREFMLVDEKGKFFTQRQYPQMTQIHVKVAEDAIALSLTDNSLEPLTFKPTLSGKPMQVEVWGFQTTAIDQGDEVAAWLQKSLQFDRSKTCRLVRQSPEYIRPVDPNYAVREEDKVSFADSHPFLLTNTASLADLNQRIQNFHQDSGLETPMNQFRPNIVVETNQPFIEDSWKVIQIGEICFDVVKACSRCLVTTTNQVSGERNSLKEPLRTLSSFRQPPGSREILFGQNLIARAMGMLKVGDEVKVLEVKSIS